VPADPLEAPLAFAPDAPERVEQPVRCLGVLKIAVELNAKCPAGVGMIAVARELGCSPVFYAYYPTAGVRAVHRADAANLTLGSGR
jgi:hypothetical protein